MDGEWEGSCKYAAAPQSSHSATTNNNCAARRKQRLRMLAELATGRVLKRYQIRSGLSS